ncbi:MAG TPA: hypothetical protein VFY18_02605 [Candidatus Limnocylindrales bacterium]|nr:hypothetical protein [Candidatus Limnocylindrales bacterium]
MSADVVVFRSERIVPRLGAPAPDAPELVPASGPEPRLLGSIEEIDDGTGPPDALFERLAAARVRLGQLTFYLLDPESWR